MTQSKCDKNTCERYQALTLLCSTEELEKFFCKVCDGNESSTITKNESSYIDKPFSIYDLYSD